MTLQDIIQVVQMETKSGSEGSVKPADWIRWTLDSITEAFSIDGCLRIQPDTTTVLSSPYTVDPDSTDPAAYDVPASLLPYHEGLESYVKVRYHESDPKNSEEDTESVKSYQKFLRCMGVQKSVSA